MSSKRERNVCLTGQRRPLSDRKWLELLAVIREKYATGMKSVRLDFSNGGVTYEAQPPGERATIKD